MEGNYKREWALFSGVQHACTVAQRGQTASFAATAGSPACGKKESGWGVKVEGCSDKYVL